MNQPEVVVLGVNEQNRKITQLADRFPTGLTSKAKMVRCTQVGVKHNVD
jgi:hypothetical protein